VENFRKTIEHRRFIGIVLIISVLFISVVGRFTDFLSPLRNFIPGYVSALSGGLSLAAAILLIRGFVKYTKALQDEEILKGLYIAETDERNVLIRAKTGGTAVNIILATLICATLICGIFNETVFYTLYATLLFISMVMLILKFYYKNNI
jgi:drug/metabolite transporter (DMT)-like permease